MSVPIGQDHYQGIGRRAVKRAGGRQAAAVAVVAVVGIPTNVVFPELELWALVDDVEIPLSLFEAGDELLVSVPFVPSAPMVGGTLTIEARHDGATATIGTLDVAGLTPAPGAWGGHTATGDPIGEIEMYLFDGNESKGRATVVGPNGALEIEYKVRCD